MIDGARVLSVCRRALATYGTDSQLAMVIEECSELVVAVAHYGRGRASLTDIADELADVTIVLAQLALFLHDNGVDVDAATAAKLGRLEKRLEGSDN
jgi:NTP pyrophosphatase (non-canonical NTP hydrolase)